MLVTYMVGSLSVMNAVAGAYSDDLPLLVVCGAPNSQDAGSSHIIHHTIGEKNLYQSAKCIEPIVAKVISIKNVCDIAGAFNLI